jgi:hypothetical protein
MRHLTLSSAVVRSVRTTLWTRTQTYPQAQRQHPRSLINRIRARAAQTQVARALAGTRTPKYLETATPSTLEVEVRTDLVAVTAGGKAAVLHGFLTWTY